MSLKPTNHCRRWRCRHVAGCLCNCGACKKQRPIDEKTVWEKSRSTAAARGLK